MADSQAHTRFLNPWLLHLQKLGLELKCPFCLELFNKPMLLPCNHIFCSDCLPKSNLFGSECPLCKLPYVEQDLREAPYLENVANIYKNLDSSFSMHMLSSDVGRGSVEHSFPAKESFPDQLPKGHMDSSSPGNSTSGTTSLLLRANERVQMPRNSSVSFKLEKCSSLVNPSLRPGKSDHNFQNNVTTFSQVRPGQEEHNEAVNVDVNQEELSPDSPPSSGASKGVETDSRDPESCDDTAEKCPLKKSVKRAAADFEEQGTYEHHDSYSKKQKKLNQGWQEIAQSQHPSTITNLQKSTSIGSDMAKSASASGNQLAVESDSASLLNYMCAFCQTWKITEGSGPMQHFANDKQVFGIEAGSSNVIHVHQSCIEWAPQIYYEDDTKLKNLDIELARAGKLKCTSCGIKGAALGCYAKSCRRSYHVPCAYEIAECRWDTVDFLMFCPAHTSLKFPSEKLRKPSAKKSSSAQMCDEQKILSESDFWVTPPTGAKNWVLCGSALSVDEKFMLVKFANLCGATVTKAWNPDVTHVVAATDANGACSRTLKVLMATLKGKWILKTNWIKACMESKCYMEEEPYEISLDNHGCCDGPKTGRLRALSNAQMLFSGLKFFFNGDFVPTYRKDLQDLIMAAGGFILESREQLLQSSTDKQSNPSLALVVYNGDVVTGMGEVSNVLLQQVEAEMVAAENGCQVIPHTWLLDSIASGALQPFVQK